MDVSNRALSGFSKGWTIQTALLILLAPGSPLAASRKCIQGPCSQGEEAGTLEWRAGECSSDDPGAEPGKRGRSPVGAGLGLPSPRGILMSFKVVGVV